MVKCIEKYFDFDLTLQMLLHCNTILYFPIDKQLFLLKLSAIEICPC